ncbi:MAG: signal peptidase I [Dehalococcoidia bacterium]
MSDDPTRREPETNPSSAPAERRLDGPEENLSAGAARAPQPAAPEGDDDVWRRPGGASGVSASHAAAPVADRGAQPFAPADAAVLHADPYGDVPAALELSYDNADLGLSERAFERTFPYEGAEGRKRRAKARRLGRELVETLILAVLIFFAVKAVVQNFRVEGSSMLPSLNNNQYLLVNKAIYYRIDTHELHKFLPFIPDSTGKKHLFRAPQRGDVIVFKFPLDPTRDFIKRVIGVPGDTVEIKGGKVYINGGPLVEPYELSAPSYTYAPKTVPPGEYFVLGDNRNNSYDSHAWQAACSPQQTCDFVPEANIIGQAWISYWPFSELGFINNTSVKPQAP